MSPDVWKPIIRKQAGKAYKLKNEALWAAMEDDGLSLAIFADHRLQKADLAKLVKNSSQEPARLMKATTVSEMARVTCPFPVRSSQRRISPG